MHPVPARISIRQLNSSAAFVGKKAFILVIKLPGNIGQLSRVSKM